MAQFDVHRNPSQRQRDAMPYMVNIQSDLLEALPTRLQMPLVRHALVPGAIPRNLCPAVDFEGERLYLLAPQVASFLVRDLGATLGSLSAYASDIVAALDAVISGV